MALLNKDIQAIIDTTRDCTWAIDDANVIVQEVLQGSGLSPSRLEIITKYLAAHFVCLVEETGGITQEKSGQSEQVFNKLPTSYKNLTRGFQLTRYGQQAIAMDTTGKLAAIANGTLKAQFSIIPDASHCRVEE